MRTRSHALVEKIESKELLLKEALRRRDLVLLGTTLQTGVIGQLYFSGGVGGASLTILMPLRAILPSAERIISVDRSATPDPTGGYGDVTVPAGKVISELEGDSIVSFIGRAAGTWQIYLEHRYTQENPQTKYPPGLYHPGTGVTPEFKTFFGVAAALGAAVPRGDYSTELTSETVTETVDRVVVGVVAAGSVPNNAHAVLQITWDGSVITGVANIYTPVSAADLDARLKAAENSVANLTVGQTNHSTRLTTNEAAIATQSGQISTLQSGKANIVHEHAISQVLDLQSALNSKQPVVTGAASTALVSNFEPNRIVVTELNGKMGTSHSTTREELGNLIGSTSNIQAQLDGKARVITGSASSMAYTTHAGGRAVVTGVTDGKLAASSITSVELSRLAGASENIQAGIEARVKNAYGSLLNLHVLRRRSGIWESSLGTNWTTVVTADEVIITHPEATLKMAITASANGYGNPLIAVPSIFSSSEIRVQFFQPSGALTNPPPSFSIIIVRNEN